MPSITACRYEALTLTCEPPLRSAISWPCARGVALIWSSAHILLVCSGQNSCISWECISWCWLTNRFARVSRDGRVEKVKDIPRNDKISGAGSSLQAALQTRLTNDYNIEVLSAFFVLIAMLSKPNVHLDLQKLFKKKSKICVKKMTFVMHDVIQITVQCPSSPGVDPNTLCLACILAFDTLVQAIIQVTWNADACQLAVWVFHAWCTCVRERYDVCTHIFCIHLDNALVDRLTTHAIKVPKRGGFVCREPPARINQSSHGLLLQTSRQVTYESTGSNRGLKSLAENGVDFAASDVYISKTDPKVCSHADIWLHAFSCVCDYVQLNARECVRVRMPDLFYQWVFGIMFNRFSDLNLCPAHCCTHVCLLEIPPAVLPMHTFSLSRLIVWFCSQKSMAGVSRM